MMCERVPNRNKIKKTYFINLRPNENDLAISLRILILLHPVLQRSRCLQHGGGPEGLRHRRGGHTLHELPHHPEELFRQYQRFKVGTRAVTEHLSIHGVPEQDLQRLSLQVVCLPAICLPHRAHVLIAAP